MAAHQDILVGETGQSLVFDAPEGRPSSVTGVQVWAMTAGDGSTAETALGAPAIESVTTTFDADSGVSQADPTICYLASTTGLVIGQRYIATNAAGETEWVEIQAITSGASVQARFPLSNDYASGATFESVRISAALDSTWIADENNISDDTDPNPGYRVRWEYVFGGKTYVHHTTFDVVRYRGEHLVDPMDMESYLPNWQDTLPSFHVQDGGRRLLDQAYRDVVIDLHRANVPDEQLRNPEVRDHLVKLKVVERAMKLRFYEARASGDQVQLAMQDYQAALDGLIRVTNKTATGVDKSGAGARPPALGFWSK